MPPKSFEAETVVTFAVPSAVRFESVEPLATPTNVAPVSPPVEEEFAHSVLEPQEIFKFLIVAP